MEATLNGITLAESEETIVIEGNHYFPADSVRDGLLSKAEFSTVCPWKGTASYYDVEADGISYPNIAWYYSNPSEAAVAIAGYVAFGAPVIVGR